MSENFHGLQESASSHVQDMLNFFTSLKKDITNMISEQDKNIATTIDDISTELVKKGSAISNDLKAFTNDAVSSYNF